MKRVLLKKKVARVMPYRHAGDIKEDDANNPDYCARRVIVHSFLYYVFDAPIISDHAYDWLVRVCVDKWDELHPDRQWALRSPGIIRSTGARVRYSSQAVGAALNYHKYNTGEIYANYREDQWLHRKKDGVCFVTAGMGKPRRVG